MADTSQPTADDLPKVTLYEFLRGLGACQGCEDVALSQDSLRAMLRDYRDHARRLLAEEEVEDAKADEKVRAFAASSLASHRAAKAEERERIARWLERLTVKADGAKLAETLRRE